MDYSCCPFCDLTVPSSALERRANGHFEGVEDDEVDKQLARDLEFAQQLALAASSPPPVTKDQAIGELPFWRCDAEISMEERVSCLIALQIRTTFHKIEGGL